MYDPEKHKYQILWNKYLNLGLHWSKLNTQSQIDRVIRILQILHQC